MHKIVNLPEVTFILNDQVVTNSVSLQVDKLSEMKQKAERSLEEQTEQANEVQMLHCYCQDTVGYR